MERLKHSVHQLWQTFSAPPRDSLATSERYNKHADHHLPLNSQTISDWANRTAVSNAAFEESDLSTDTQSPSIKSQSDKRSPETAATQATSPSEASTPSKKRKAEWQDVGDERGPRFFNDEAIDDGAKTLSHHYKKRRPLHPHSLKTTLPEHGSNTTPSRSFDQPVNDNTSSQSWLCALSTQRLARIPFSLFASVLSGVETQQLPLSSHIIPDALWPSRSTSPQSVDPDTPIDSIEGIDEGSRTTNMNTADGTARKTCGDTLLEADEQDAVRNYRLNEVAVLSDEGWPAVDVALYRKLMMRGFEPVLTSRWAAHFPTLPRSLFTSDPNAPIDTVNNDGSGNADAQGTSLMQRLFEVGPRVRGNTKTRAPPERWPYLESRTFHNWLRRDAGICGRLDADSIPINMVIVRSSKHTPPQAIQAKIVREFEQTEEDWMVRLQLTSKVDLPPLYGFICVGSSVIVLSWNATGTVIYNGEDGRLRRVMVINFNNRAYDAWNAIAIAIVMCHARDELVQTMMQHIFEPIETDDLDGIFVEGARLGGRWKGSDPDR